MVLISDNYPRDLSKDDKVLEVKMFGKNVSNPLVLAAGFDKHAEAIEDFLDLGFGAVEVGSVTPLPQPGNPPPVLFILKPDHAAINRYGFNSKGHAVFKENLIKRAQDVYHHDPTTPNESGNLSFREGKMLGINLGKNKASPQDSFDDYVLGVKELGMYADFIVINVSCPNLPGLRALQEKDTLKNLLNAVLKARDELPRQPPFVVKISPDVTDDELENIANTLMEIGRIDAVVLTNTSTKRPSTLKSDPELLKEAGGLSGEPLFPMSIEVVRKFYKLTNGKIPIMGCGGVSSAKEVLAFARAGATMVQLFTRLSYECYKPQFDGPCLLTTIKKDLVEALNKEGKTWMDIIGEEHKA
ncbi:Dihydroorotate dehydrogenase [Piromyces finnis]|uniref:Dihydroorotate dehydrogenase (quinone), mitochondrial n=1 Tax=Piromyces finnis TaxID=1754191 RepID=A0A1Y1VDI5_9FUNG|nr:Dihydroorotate dehydrogenase [Piromyces finnis]|eukprot:ORX52621.1 Dihydroorotate dehydrogenase [Piromyces finnis]